MPRRKEPRIPDAILDQLLAGADPKTAFDPNGLLDELKKALAERALNAEMDHHLSGEEGAGNSRNGYGRKTVVTDTGRIELAVPRDRQASFDPQLIAKYQRRFPGFDDKIVSMYARGMSTREIAGHLRELYGVDVSPDLISAETDAVLEEVAWTASRGVEGWNQNITRPRACRSLPCRPAPRPGCGSPRPSVSAAGCTRSRRTRTPPPGPPHGCGNGRGGRAPS